MAPSSFAVEVFSRVPPEFPAGLVRQVVEAFQLSGRAAQPGAAASAIQEIGRRAALMREGGLVERRERVRPRVRLTPRTQARARQLQAAMRPSVEALRRALFSSPNPPFRARSPRLALQRAARWITAEAQRQRPRAWPAQQIARLDHNLMRLAREYSRVLDGWGVVNVGIERTVLSYWAVERDQLVSRAIVVRDGSPLGRLAHDAEALARATGCAREDLVAHVLCGLPLRLPSVEAWVDRRVDTLPDGQRLSRVIGHLVVHDPDLHVEQWKRLYRNLRRAWARVEPATPATWVVAAVSARGGPPRKGAVRFWTQIWTEGRARGFRWSSWRAPMMIWRRARHPRRRTL
jgi:ribosomal protein L20